MPAEPGPEDRARHVALIIEALLATRPTAATDRFDAEVSAAVAEGHLDATAARALRYRQRASVRAVETYLLDTLGAILGTQRAADTRAAADVEDDDLAWDNAQLLTAPLSEPHPGAATSDDFGAVEEPAARDVVRLAAVPDLEQPARSRTSAETKAAIRAALQS